MSSAVDSMEIIQKLVLETLEKDSSIPDTRVLGTEFTQQQVLGVLMRLESHQVRECERLLVFFNTYVVFLDDWI